MMEFSIREAVINFIRRDFWRKLVAVVLALLLYQVIATKTSERREKSFANVPVNVELPADLFLNNPDALRVKVTLGGKVSDLDNIDPLFHHLIWLAHLDTIPVQNIIPGIYGTTQNAVFQLFLHLRRDAEGFHGSSPDFIGREFAAQFTGYFNFFHDK